MSLPRLIREAGLQDADWRLIRQRRRLHNRLGFAYQMAFVRVVGRFPQQEPLEIDDDILRFIALQLSSDPADIHAYKSRRQTIADHQHMIQAHLDLRPFDAAAARELSRLSADPDFPFDRTLLQHVSPIQWHNIILYGEIRINPDKLWINAT
ncbi:MAG: DUF4158 domain-containing protein [Rhodobacter sp.]|nr:DUF4158 domain-containing protein [Rhodobacter sp.]